MRHWAVASLILIITTTINVVWANGAEVPSTSTWGPLRPQAFRWVPERGRGILPALKTLLKPAAGLESLPAGEKARRNDSNLIHVERLQALQDRLSWSPSLPGSSGNAILSQQPIRISGEWISRSAQYVGPAKVVGTWMQTVRGSNGKTLYVSGAALDSPPTHLEPEVVRMDRAKEAIVAKLRSTVSAAARAPLVFPPRVEIQRDERSGYIPVWVIDFVAEHEQEAFRARFNSKEELISVDPVGTGYADGEALVYPNGPKASELAAVTLPMMLGDGNLSNLKVRVFSALDPRAWAPNLVFRYALVDNRFDEVQTYFYVDRALRWFKANVGLELSAPIEVKTHVGQNGKSNAAFYYNKRIFLGTGDGVVYHEMMKDPSIVMHETAHAIIDEAAALPSQGEGGAINEGFADFFTGCILDSPFIGEVAYLQGPYRRTLSNQLKAYRDFNEGVYNNGSIVAATFWDIRKVLGTQKTAQLALRTLVRLGEGARFDDLGVAVIYASEGKLTAPEMKSVHEILSERGWKVP